MGYRLAQEPARYLALPRALSRLGLDPMWYGPTAGHRLGLLHSPRVIDHYMEGSVIAYYGELVEEIIAAEQGGLTEGEEALLQLLKKKLRREMRRAA